MGQINDKGMSKEKDKFDEIVDKQLLHNAVHVRPDFIRIQKQTDFSPLELTRLYTNFKQTAPNGALTEEQCVEGFGLCFPHGDSEKYARHVFRTADIAAKGYLTFEDLAVFLNVLTRNSNVPNKLSWIFRLYDTDEDGYLTAENMVEILTCLYTMGGCNPDAASESAKKHVANLPFFNASHAALTEDEFISACHKDEAIMRSLTSACETFKTNIF